MVFSLVDCLYTPQLMHESPGCSTIVPLWLTVLHLTRYTLLDPLLIEVVLQAINLFSGRLSADYAVAAKIAAEVSDILHIPLVKKPLQL